MIFDIPTIDSAKESGRYLLEDSEIIKEFIDD